MDEIKESALIIFALEWLWKRDVSLEQAVANIIVYSVLYIIQQLRKKAHSAKLPKGKLWGML